jgi:hypothetical protein
MTLESVIVDNFFLCGFESIDKTFKRLDECGGWPVAYTHLTALHTCTVKRPCRFYKVQLNNEWTSTMYTSDDYYKWKLSKKGYEAIKDEGKRELKNQIMKMK